MNHKEICAIMKACVKSKVKELEFSGLKLKFFDPMQGQSLAAIIPQVAQDPESQQKQVDQNKEVLRELEFKAKEDQLAQMLINNPSEWEEEMLSGDLEAGDAQSQARGSESSLP